MAVEPSPSCSTVMGLGCSWSKGVSGYSKLIEWAMISCPWAETR